MDIDRLKKIKQICFNSKGKRQPSQNAIPSKSPIDTVTLESLNQFSNCNKENNSQMQNNKSPYKLGLTNKDLLKTYENQLIMAYKTKQDKLEQNMKSFNEALKRKKENIQSYEQKEREQRKSMSPPRARSSSPYYLAGVGGDPIVQNYSSNVDVRRQLSRSPFSNEKQNTISLQKSFGGSTSQFGINPVFSEIEEGSFENKVQQLKSKMIKLVDLLQNPHNESLMQPRAIDDIKLRLIGAFDMAQQATNIDKNQSLLVILEGCFNDLYNQISQKIIKKNDNQYLPQLESFIYNLIEQIASSNLEDIVPQISSVVLGLKLNLACNRIKTVCDKGKSQLLFRGFHVIKEYSISRSFMHLSVKHIIAKHLRKLGKSRIQRCFSKWNQDINKEKQSISQLINQNYNTYFKSIISQSAQELSVYFEETRLFISKVLEVGFNNIEIITEINSSKEQSNDPLEMVFPIYNSKLNKYSSKGTLFYTVKIISNQDQSNKAQKSSQQYSFMMSKLAPLLADSWKSFKKLNKQFQSFNEKLDAINDISTINDRTLQQMHYLQTKSCELNLVTSISESFKLIDLVVRELFNYDKCYLFVYSQGQISKIYDASKGNSTQDLGYCSEGTNDNQQIRDLVTLQIEGKSILYKQELLTVDDPFDINRQCLKDYVMIQLEQTSCDLSQSVISQINQSFLSQQNNRYFVRLEKTIKKAKEQENFETRCDTQVILRSFIQICLIAVNKMLIIANSQPMIVANDSEIEQDSSKINQENDDLKRIIEMQKAIDCLMNDIKNANSIRHFDDLQARLSLFIKDNIPNSEHVKLYLTNDGGQVLYTYQNTDNHNLLSTGFISNSQNTLFKNNIRQISQIGLSSNKQGRIIVSAINQRNQYKISRSRSQLAGPNNQFPSQLDDISSISGGDIGNLHINANEKNIMLNGFQFDSVQINQQQPQPLSRDPSFQLLMSSCSNNNLKRNPMQVNKFSHQLYRDNSMQSDFYPHKQRKLVSNITDLIYEENNNLSASKQKRKTSVTNNNNSSYNDILNELAEDEFEIMGSLQNQNNRIEIKPFERVSIMSQALQYKKGLIKRNAKNDKNYNHYIDGLILSGIDPPQTLENLVYEVIINSNHGIQGVIQIGNCDKDSQFEEADQEVLQMLCHKLGNLISETRESHSKKQMFKKQLEVSVLNTSLENQTVTKILTLANKLFSSSLPPVRAASTFLQKTEKYLNRIFNCQASQILMIDSSQNEFFSFDSHQIQQIVKRGNLTDNSIAGYIVSSNLSGSFIYPPITEYILINDDSQNGFPNQMINPQYFNPKIDIPQQFSQTDTSNSNRIPKSYLAKLINDSHDKPIAVLQLICKLDSIRFSEADARHVKLVGDHLSQVFSYIDKQGYLNQLSIKQQQGVSKIAGTLSKKYKSYAKLLFRELLAYKMGKVNMLQNKIIRKHLNMHMQLDNQLVKKLQRLQVLSQKFTKRTKQQIIQKFRQKVAQITTYRRQNGKQCMKIMQKYDKILQERVKDTAFRLWFNKHKFNSSMGSIECNFMGTFNANQSLSGLSQSNNVSILEESSITSVLYQKAKAVYKIRKLFNRHKLEIYFNCFLIKSVGNRRNFLHKTNSLNLKRILALRSFLSIRIKETLRIQFDKFQNIISTNDKKKQVVRKMLQRRHQKLLTFGVQTWHEQSEQSIRRELRQERSYASQLSEQCKDATLLQQILAKSNALISSTLEDTSVEQCLVCPQMSQLLSTVAETMLNHHMYADSIVITIKVPNHASRHLMFSYRTQEGDSLFQQDGGITQFLSVTGPIGGASEVQKSCQKDISQLSISQFASFQELFQVRNKSPYQQPNNNNNNTNEKHDQEQSVQYPILQIIEQEDLIIQSLTQTQSAFIINNLQNDDMLQEPLEIRKMNDCKQAMILPLKSHHSSSQDTIIYGSVEIYLRDSSSQFSYEDQNRFKQHAQTLYTGLEALLRHVQMIQKVQKAQILQDMNNIVIEEPFDSSRPLTLSQLSQMMSSNINNVFKSSHCQVFFIYGIQQYGTKRGLFFTDNAHSKGVQYLDFKGTILEELVQYNSARQLTLPSSLLCKEHYPASQLVDQQETFNTLDRQKYQAVKYIPITKQGSQEELVAIIEIGWSDIQDAQLVHFDNNYLYKKEKAVKEIFLDQIKALKCQLLIFVLTISKKIREQNLNVNGKRMFNLWKQLYYTKPYASNENQQHQQANQLQVQQQQQNEEQNYQYSPLQPRQIIQNFMTEKQQPVCSPYSNLYMPSRPALIAPQNRSALKVTSVHQSVNEGEELDVERIAKRKLISAAFIMISISDRIAKKKGLKHAFCEWKSFVLSSQLTELAFNKLLEINHRHSNARYYAATQILGRIFVKKNSDMRDAVDKIKTLSILFDGRKQQLNQLQQQPYNFLGNNYQVRNELHSGIDPSKYTLHAQKDQLNQQHSVGDYFRLQELEESSEFSLGNGTKDLIQFKAESILERARNQFKLTDSNRK